MKDNIVLIALWTVNLAMIIGVIFRSRQCAAIVMPFPIVLLFIALPRMLWFLPIICAVLWLMLACTFPLRGISMPEEYLRTRGIKQDFILMIRVGLPLLAVIIVIAGFVIGWDVLGAILLLPGFNILVVLCALGFAMAVPAFLWVIFIFAVCPMIVQKREACQAKKIYCVKLFEKKGRYREVAVPHVKFDGDPAHYRVSWMFYRKMQRAALGEFTYEKCFCPLGVVWIKNVREQF